MDGPIDTSVRRRIVNEKKKERERLIQMWSTHRRNVRGIKMIASQVE